MSNKGFSHIGLSTLDLDKTRAFYEDVLGFKPVVADTLRIQEGGHLRHVFFDVGRDQLRAKGLDVTDIVDHGWAKSIYFSDPNGLSLEYCCLVRDLTEDDAVMQERGTIPLARLGFKNTAGAELTRVPSTRGKVMA